MLKDTPHALSRLRTPEAQKFERESTIDFASVYTTIRWADVSLAFRFWRSWYALNVEGSNISAEERAFMGMLFHTVPKEESDFLCAHFPFFAMQYSPDLMVGECLLHVVFFHTAFETPGLGIFLQLVGFPMGTNCAPTWANLVLRCYERVHAFVDSLLLRFIDDGLVLHHDGITEAEFLERMQKPYPAHLRVGVETFNRCTNIPFMDLLIVRLHPLKTSVYFKPTHTSSYIPWNSNTPRHVKVGWIVAECVRFLRIGSHEEYFLMCWRRLKSALVRFRYPPHVYHKPPRQWVDRDAYLKPRERTTDVVHVVHAPFHASMPIPWAAIFSPL